MLICSWGALQEMRTYKEAEQAGKHVGFELINSVDIAVASPVAGPWYVICSTWTHARIAMIVQPPASMRQESMKGIFECMTATLGNGPVLAGSLLQHLCQGDNSTGSCQSLCM